MIDDAAYWIAVSQLTGWRHERLNNLIIRFFHEQKIQISDFFDSSQIEWRSVYELNEKEISGLLDVKSEIANNSFLAESLYNQGYEIIPITSPEYSKTLKTNLKTQYSPAVLYVKGNKQIMSEKSIAIVGSRNASDISLEFTDNIARLASREYKVVVSGFAKGVDKQALDSAIKYKGQSIIVLPQGILTFGSGFKTYYRQIVDGDVLVLSTFFPKTPWRTDLAMARNPIIYGLADEIYVAESSEKGGTWSGVTDGLRKNRIIYVRKPENIEQNANLMLIQKGAVPVDFNGNKISIMYPDTNELQQHEIVSEPEESIENKIRNLLEKKPHTVKEILEKIETGWTSPRLASYLKKLDLLNQ
jgi:predicted Rossmann fold nucleotide-binding protein DprA/Smf involved in DNA uptake